MARSSDDQPTAVSDSSDTSGQANPMAEAPANPTEAQQEQGAESDAPVGAPEPSEAAKQQQRDDDAWRAEHPGEVLIREPNPEMGGESFARYEDPQEADPPTDANAATAPEPQG